MAGTRILLVDNGSYEPAATLALRGLALEVGKLIGQEVRPVSTMHSTKIGPALLGGQPGISGGKRDDAQTESDDGEETTGHPFR